MSKKKGFESFLFTTTLLGCSALVMLYYAHFVTTHSLEKQISYSEKIREANINLAAGHIWLEKFIAGDKTISKAKIFDLFSRSQKLVGKAEKDMKAIGDPAQQKILKQIQSLLVRIIDLAGRRVAQISTSGIGSKTNNKIDTLFRQVHLVFERLRSQADEKALAEKGDRMVTFSILVFVWVLLVGFTLEVLRKDTSTRKQAEDELRKERAMLRVAEKVGDIGSWEWNMETGKVFVSKNYCVLLGIPPEMFDGTVKTIMKHIHPDDKRSVQIELGRMLKKKRSRHFEYRVIKHDGSVRNHFGTGSIFCDDDGTVIRLVGIVQDVTKRKLAENRLRESSFFLEESQKVAQLGTYSLDIESGRWASSPILDNIFGIAEDPSFVLSAEEWLDLVHADWRNEMSEYFFNHVVGQKNNFDREYPIIRKNDGELRWVAGKGELKFDKDGCPVKMIGTIQDITERKKSESALLSAKEEAEKGNRAKSTFLTSMSHEIRTPLTSIMGFSQLLATDVENPLTDSQKNILGKIVDSGRQLLGLVDDMLELSKIESGKMGISKKPVDMDHLALEAQTSMAQMAERFGVRIVVQKPAVPYLLTTDRACLLRAIQNLLSNAIKYNHEGGSATLSWDLADSSTISVFVADDGQGIEEGKLGGLFEPFERLGMEGRNIEGTGIGLTIVKKLVESMEGEVWVKSEVGKGSVFCIRLPLETRTDTKQKGVKSHHPGTIEEGSCEACDSRL